MNLDNHLILIYAAFSYHTVADPVGLCGRLSVRCRKTIQRRTLDRPAHTPSWCHHDGRFKMHDALLTQPRFLLKKCLLLATAICSHNTGYLLRCVILMTPDLFVSQLAPLNCLLHWLDHTSDLKDVG